MLDSDIALENVAASLQQSQRFPNDPLNLYFTSNRFFQFLEIDRILYPPNNKYIPDFLRPQSQITPCEMTVATVKYEA